MNDNLQDGIHNLLPRERMRPAARKLRDAYSITPEAPIFQREFYIWEEALERWKTEGMPEDADINELFQFDPPGNYGLSGLGWCEAALIPPFESKVIEDRGNTEVVQDHAGRHVLCFKGRRHGFMPEYLDHPVKDMETWTENVKWRLDPSNHERIEAAEQAGKDAVDAAGKGLMIVQRLIGGYMYLRSLIGPESLLYAFYDKPELIRNCMERWFELSDTVIARHQQYVTLDEIFFAEDICYNHGPLISPDMISEFLFPYYQQLIENVKKRQIDQDRHLFVHVDTDGYADPVIPLYSCKIGMDAMSPFEVASGSDVVRTRSEHPQLVISGGIDKRILASTKNEIDGMLERIIPEMRRYGGYIPTCDHGVPVEVSYENYFHYRQRCIELGA